MLSRNITTDLEEAKWKERERNRVFFLISVKWLAYTQDHGLLPKLCFQDKAAYIED